ASADYLVFVDGDCVLHPQFLSDHVAHRAHKTVLAGRRVSLTRWVTRLITPQRIRKDFIQKNYAWIFFVLLPINHSMAAKGVRFTSKLGRMFADRKPRGILGCNFSLYKQDLLDINGFDTRYQSPGIGEDTDIDFRLRLNGCKTKPLIHAAIQYHLYHRLLTRTTDNDQIFAEVKSKRKHWTVTGLQAQMRVGTKVPTHTQQSLGSGVTSS
ncbi:MAG: galactosyltransferase-related protein, partial [Gammaproteobacteria bacterium]|nr:galactosyltransferase-related protein [Gammaproteobacteria bacterium]